MMMRGVTFILFIWLAGLPLFAQRDIEDIVQPEDLEYNSYFEEISFIRYMEGERNFFRMLLSIDPSMNEEKYEILKRELELKKEDFRYKKFVRAKPEKKIRLLHNNIQQHVLTKYKENVLFPDLFSSGHFNCLTASAYYGLLLDSLHVSYEFRESANHVHPVAWPEKYRIKIETTDPLYGIEYFDDKLKYRFVNYLLSSRVIGREEFNTTSLDELFYRYYFPDRSIGLEELTGLQYMNDALFNFNRDNYQYAFSQIKKAYFLYPSKRMLTILQFILAGVIDAGSYSSLEDVRYMVFISHFPPEMINLDILNNEFINLTEQILVNNSNYQLYDDIFNYLMENMDNGELKDMIRFQYGILRGKAYMGQFKFNEALDLFEMSFSMNPRHLELQTLLVNTLAYTFMNSSNREIVNRVEDYSRRFDELNENGMFISLQMSAYLAYAEELFDFNYGEEGVQYLRKFEKVYGQNPDIDVNYEEVGDAYSAGAVYYFKRYDKIRARKFLERGLEIAPDNFELKYRLRSL